ncbi:MAG: hypothetical protein HY791_06335 [Deltaproteobacteria bacterium]|nr:hypothetical protein [Deltaproteobacteria bacterium]
MPRRIRERLVSVDRSLWIILLGTLIRIDTAIRFNPLHGYDAPDHVKIMELLGRGVVARIEDNWEAQHPPLFYALALAGSLVGLGDRGGQLVSVLAGATRLLVANHLYEKLERLVPTMPRQTRLAANALHAFLPVSLRMDVFFNPESLAATLSLASVALALAPRPFLAGLVLGAALLSKSSAVAAVPAVGLALLLAKGTFGERARKLAVTWALGASILMTWAWPNVKTHHTPYPPAQLIDKAAAWQKPVLERHSSAYFLPKFTHRQLTYPFYTPPLSMPNVLLVDAWGDYYNFLNRGIRHEGSEVEIANGRLLGKPKLWINTALAHLSVVYLAGLAFGVVWALVRIRRAQFPRVELAMAAHGAGYVSIMVAYGIWHALETDGPAKAAYGMGSSGILCWWTAAAFAWCLGRGGVTRWVAALLLAAPGVLAGVGRILW